MHQNMDEWMGKQLNLWFASWARFESGLTSHLYLVFRKMVSELANITVVVQQYSKWPYVLLEPLSKRTLMLASNWGSWNSIKEKKFTNFINFIYGNL